MKQLLSLLLLFNMASYAQKSTKVPLQMKGVYAINYQKINNGIKDEVIPIKQLKIYTDRYVMYAAKRSPIDSLASFGIGTYKIENGKVMEYFFYLSNAGKVNDTAALVINKLPKGYKQVIVYPPYKDTIFTLTETYDKVDKPIVSPLDGAWKLTKSYIIGASGDTTIRDFTEYKTYQNGHFMWCVGIKDSSAQNIGFFGYGTFTMKGTKLTEVNTNTTFMTDLYNKPVAIDIKFLGKDSYMQTHSSNLDGKAVEVYERM